MWNTGNNWNILEILEIIFWYTKKMNLGFQILIAFTLPCKLFMQACQATHIQGVTHALLEMHTQKNTILGRFCTHFLIFANIFLKHFVLRFFSNTCYLLCWNKLFQGLCSLSKMQRCISPWSRLLTVDRFSLNLLKQKETLFL